MDSLHEQITGEDKIRERVSGLYNDIGVLMSDLEHAGLLVDPFSQDCPIVGSTSGFTRLTGYPLESLLGRNSRLLIEGMPRTANSEGNRTGIRDFCEMCRVKGLTNAECCGNIVLNSRKDGTRFHNMFMLGLCKIGPYALILGVHMSIGEEHHIDYSEMKAKKETGRDTLKSVRRHLMSNCRCITPEEDPLQNSRTPSNLSMGSQQPDFAFFSERLQSHCLLLHNRTMAVRREPTKVPRDCLLFGDRPVRHSTEGLSFSVKIHQREVFTTRLFSGLPLMGFTKRGPKDIPDLYPFCGHYCGASVMIGADGQAFARDRFEHYSVLDKRPSIEDIQMFSVDPSKPCDLQRAAIRPQHGDVLCCTYLRSGHIVLEVNGEMIIAFDVERPIDDNAQYYAVLDLCFSVYSVMLVPTKKAQSESAEQIRRQVSKESQMSSMSDFPLSDSMDEYVTEFARQ